MNSFNRPFLRAFAVLASFYLILVLAIPCNPPSGNLEPGCHYNSRAHYYIELTNDGQISGLNNFGTVVGYSWTTPRNAFMFGGDFNEATGAYEKSGATLKLSPLNKVSNPSGETSGRKTNDENVLVGFGHPTAAKTNLVALYSLPSPTDNADLYNASKRGQVQLMQTSPLPMPFPQDAVNPTRYSAFTNSFAFSISNDVDTNSADDVHTYIVPGMISADSVPDPAVTNAAVEVNGPPQLVREIGVNTRAVYWNLTGPGGAVNIGSNYLPRLTATVNVIPGLEDTRSESRAVNNIGNIVGSKVSAANTLGFVYCRHNCNNSNLPYELPPLSGDSTSFALSIDDWLTQASPVKPLVQATPTPTPNPSYSDGANYNMPGQVFGFSKNAVTGFTRAAIWKYDRANDRWNAFELSIPPANSVTNAYDQIYASNGLGLAVGNGKGRAVLIRDGQEPLDLNLAASLPAATNNSAILLTRAIDVSIDGTIAVEGTFSYNNIWNRVFFLLKPTYYSWKLLPLPEASPAATPPYKDPVPNSIATYSDVAGSQLYVGGYGLVNMNGSAVPKMPFVWRENAVFNEKRLETFDTGPLSKASISTILPHSGTQALAFGTGSNGSLTIPLIWSFDNSTESAPLRLPDIISPAALSLNEVKASSKYGDFVYLIGTGKNASQPTKGFVAYGTTAGLSTNTGASARTVSPSAMAVIGDITETDSYYLSAINSQLEIAGSKGTTTSRSAMYWKVSPGSLTYQTAVLPSSRNVTPTPTPTPLSSAYQEFAQDVETGTTALRDDGTTSDNKDAVVGYVKVGLDDNYNSGLIWRRDSAGSWRSFSTSSSPAPKDSVVVRYTKNGVSYSTKFSAVNDKVQVVGSVVSTKALSLTCRPEPEYRCSCADPQISSGCGTPTVNLAVLYDAYNPAEKIKEITNLIPPSPPRVGNSVSQMGFYRIENAFDIDNAGRIAVSGIMLNGRRGAALVIPPDEAANASACKR